MFRGCGSHGSTDTVLWTLRWENQLHRSKRCGVGERDDGSVETIRRWLMRTSLMMEHHTAKPEACYSK